MTCQRQALTACVAAWLTLGLSATASADYVTYWNEIADNTSIFAGGPSIRARILAITQLAVHDALNSIDSRYASYTGVPPANAGASPEAAVAAAAYAVLSHEVPSQAGAVLIQYDQWIASLPACPAAHPACIEDGIAAGEAAANAMLALRENDGSATPHLPYTLAPGPGVYQPHAAVIPGSAVRRGGSFHSVRAQQRLAVSRRPFGDLQPRGRGVHARLQRGQTSWLGRRERSLTARLTRARSPCSGPAAAGASMA